MIKSGLGHELHVFSLILPIHGARAGGKMFGRRLLCNGECRMCAL